MDRDYLEYKNEEGKVFFNTTDDLRDLTSYRKNVKEEEDPVAIFAKKNSEIKTNVDHIIELQMVKKAINDCGIAWTKRSIESDIGKVKVLATAFGNEPNLQVLVRNDNLKKGKIVTRALRGDEVPEEDKKFIRDNCKPQMLEVLEQIMEKWDWGFDDTIEGRNLKQLEEQISLFD